MIQVEIRQENGARSYAIYSEGRAKGLLALTQPESVVRDSEGTITPRDISAPARFSDQARQKGAEGSHFRLGQEAADTSA